eukprot:6448212-Amphidinium_carterae.1
MPADVGRTSSHVSEWTLVCRGKGRRERHTLWDPQIGGVANRKANKGDQASLQAGESYSERCLRSTAPTRKLVSPSADAAVKVGRHSCSGIGRGAACTSCYPALLWFVLGSNSARSTLP